jgi:hypothetical protein
MWGTQAFAEDWNYYAGADEVHPSGPFWPGDLMMEGVRLPDVFFFRLPQHFFLDFHVSEFV